jgi:2-methylfumaryl-CoA hydratase
MPWRPAVAVGWSGGHIISVCRALSYDGLENALSILAINGGSHVNPTYAGDTIACATQVIEKLDLGQDHLGGCGCA